MNYEDIDQSVKSDKKKTVGKGQLLDHNII